ncbi:ABC1 family protein [Striga asiatica]|uniref:ABC1 family protein n=1 Tax=Striga asiatica TaxID=4170 RepID=A0A5A7Q3L5_STRAF|nr:ABC1 family protein [Striga asiatica]
MPLPLAQIFSCRPLGVLFSSIIRYILSTRCARKLFPMGWGSIYKRRVKVFTLAIVIYLDYKTLQMREKWTKKSKRADLWEKAHECNAKRVLKLIVELEGLWVKLGQYLSTRADVLPPAYIGLLRQLQDSLPPRSLKEVCRTINRELGKSMEDLFFTFDNIPLATASIAQVHRATLSDGQKVVVKVQHDGIKEIILEDLKNAKSIVDWIAWAEPQYNFNPMIDEWCKEAPKELDFNHEAENTRKVSRNLGCKSNSDGNNLNRVDVLIPEIIMSTERVLILEYMDGVRLNDSEALQALGVDKQKLVEEITRAYAHQIYVDGFFNGDPHPGNFLVSKDPPHRPILLDFGLTKGLSSSMKQALAKMFLASAEGDHVALLSSFAEMGLKLRLDIPEQVMEISNVFFRNSTPANEAQQNVKAFAEQRSKNMKVLQEKMKLNEKEVKRFNPVDAFPGDIIIFSRVINLLRGLSTTLDVRIVYLDIMRPFAESVLQCNVDIGPAFNANWIHDTPVLSSVEGKLRKLLIELGNANKVLGIQVCAYKDGEVIIDTAAGVLGRYDPRPVQPDSLFPVFSVSKGITAGMVHWLVDKGKLKLEDKVANIWPEFGSSGKDQIKVHHVLNHTSGLHNALASLTRENPLLMTDWDQCLDCLTMTAPETEPGHEQLYHYLSFGWLCGGIIEHASRKKFQDILEEAFIRPLHIDGELYIGIPPGMTQRVLKIVKANHEIGLGVESRLATLTSDMDDIKKLADISTRRDLPSTFQSQIQNVSQMASTLPALFNTLNARRAIIPAANAHCSARALARYYAALVDQGTIPPPHSSSTQPMLGTHPHTPKFPSPKPEKKKEKKSKNHGKNYTEVPTSDIDGFGQGTRNDKIFSNGNIHDAFTGSGEYESLALAGREFGLGFKRSYSGDGELIGFGHSGMGGSTGYCDVKNRFAIAVTLNKMNLGGVTAKVVQLVCSELDIPLPADFYRFTERLTSDDESNVAVPLIN